MEKADKPSYESETVLGQLYDQVVQHPVAQEVMHYAVVDANAVGHQWLLDDPAVPCWPKQLLQVRQPDAKKQTCMMSVLPQPLYVTKCLLLPLIIGRIYVQYMQWMITCIYLHHWSAVGFLSVATIEGS